MDDVVPILVEGRMGIVMTNTGSPGNCPRLAEVDVT
jgi:hypothetical protein